MYRALGLPVGASAAEVKAAYRRLAMQLHPDLASGTGAAGAALDARLERFREVTAAFQALTAKGDKGRHAEAQARGTRARERRNEKGSLGGVLAVAAVIPLMAGAATTMPRDADRAAASFVGGRHEGVLNPPSNPFLDEASLPQVRRTPLFQRWYQRVAGGE